MKNSSISFFKKNILTAAVILSVIVSSCKKDKNTDEVLAQGPELNFYALTQDSKLLTINAKTASSIISSLNISGLQTGESILGIDFRPATGQLYGIGSSSRLYVIDVKTGVARAINATAFTPAISGTLPAGFDFNPTVDRIRLVTSTGQNLRLNPETGGVAATDGTINGVTNASIGAVAYTQNRAGATATVLYDIDITNNKLHKQDPPNDGKLVEVGNLNVDAEETGGFDISPDGTTALAALTVGGKYGLYTINLSSGSATKIGNLSSKIIGLAIPTEPVAYAISTANELLIFNPLNPTPIAKPITGMQAAETVLGIDFRPVNGQLFALGSTSRLYAINPSSGAATLIGTGPLTILLTGTSFGFDFNPTVDRIRVVSNTGQNLRLNPVDGSVAAVDGNISISTALITGAAYTNNFAGSTTTVLYDIDAQSGMLYKQDPPNNGVLTVVGSLGVTGTADAGFDIGSTSGTGYALITSGTTTRIYNINLTTGAATAGTTLPQAARSFTIGLGF
ncbi:MAG: DUF4394 domain-containing protein [Janthinobacterium lividum]